MSFPLLLAEEAAGTWTNMEVTMAMGGLIALIAVASFVVDRLVRRRTALSVERKPPETEKLSSVLLDSQGATSLFDSGELHSRLQEAIEQVERLKSALGSTENEKKAHLAQTREVARQLQAAKAASDKTQAELAFIQKRIRYSLNRRAPNYGGKLPWDVPAFRPLDGDERRMPIIAICNLKGGVGKTTIAANVAACLHGRGQRTLMLDLDLQGSLTNLYLSDDAQDLAFQTRKVIGEFLSRSFDSELPNLIDFRHDILQDVRSGLVPTADDLAYTEMGLSARWLLRAGRRDPRFLLRAELHRDRITESHDAVIIDCPPVMNIFCVNALAASDYVIIPILPTRQSTVRVPVLLQQIRELQTNVTPHLKILGIVCNRSFRENLTSDEAARFETLRRQCLDVWGEDVHQFQTLIKQSAEIRRMEDEHRPLGPEDSMFRHFAALTDEITDRLPAFCLAQGAAAEVEIEEVVV